MSKSLEDKIKEQRYKLERAETRMVEARTQTAQSNAPYENAYLKRMAIKVELDRLCDEAGILYNVEVLPKKSMRIR
jgi:hypothetical protein